ncbi:MAG: hypothetical protein OEX07_08715 [Gammaproteobacteria bacterium]|nr:hypothetical protein [Gammaproteobacteria bacterium]
MIVKNKKNQGSFSGFLIIGFVMIFSLAACFHNEPGENFIADTQSITDVHSVGYTYHSSDGNRLVKGAGSINTIIPVDISLPSAVSWIASVASGQSSYWVAVLDNGSVKAFKVDASANNQSGNVSAYEEVDITPSKLSMPVPPTLVLQNDGKLKLGNVFANASVNTGAVILNANGDRAYITNSGYLVVSTTDNEKTLPVKALPYSRILLDDNERLLVLTGPTFNYDHVSVLGSSYAHASSITLIETTPDIKVISTIDIPSPDVIEGNALMWVDVDGDGQREIITTLSSRTNEGKIVVFNEDGSQKSAGIPIGLYHRWRHQVAVAPFKSAEEMDLLSTYIPHLGPEIEFFRLDDSSMSTESRQPVSYSSHLYGGLNIDMGIAGDFDGDAKVEFLLVNRNNRSEIGAFEYNNGAVELDWTIPLSDSITSNVAAVTLDDNRIAYGVGQGNVLRIWNP